MQKLTHFDSQGAARMVDVGEKAVTVREARASGCVRMRAETALLIRQRGLEKGDVLGVARLAGIMGAKRCGELIPLCHSVALDTIEVSFQFPDQQSVAIEAVARATARTGVEMEALLAVTTAALAIYDMCKSVDRAMVIERVRLEEKSGGRSGHFRRSS